MKKVLLIVLPFVIGGILSSCSKNNTNPIGVLSLPAGQGSPVQVTVNETQLGKPIPENFMGLAMGPVGSGGYSSYIYPENAVLIQLLKNIGPGLLRVCSADGQVWTGQPRSAETGADSMTTTDVDKLAGFANAVGWPVLFGLNLGTYNVSGAVNEAQYVTNGIPKLYAFQIGNEPNVYKNRPTTYTYSNFKSEWDNYFSAIRNVLPNSSFAGPDVSFNTQWVASFAADENANIKMATSHWYQLSKKAPTITVDTLLQSGTAPAYIQTNVQSAGNYSLPYRISECNSINEGGLKGVSDAFASALWAYNFMWQVIQNNGVGVNFTQGNGSAYSPIGYTNNISFVRPEYYGLLAYKYGIAGGTTVPATLSQTTSLSCSSYACVKPNNEVDVSLINKESATDIAFTIQLTGTAQTVKILRLSAPSLTATDGVTFGGSSVQADGTFSVAAQDTFTVNNKTLVVNVPAGSAAIVVIQK